MYVVQPSRRTLSLDSRKYVAHSATTNHWPKCWKKSKDWNYPTMSNEHRRRFWMTNKNHTSTLNAKWQILVKETANVHFDTVATENSPITWSRPHAPPTVNGSPCSLLSYSPWQPLRQRQAPQWARQEASSCVTLTTHRAATVQFVMRLTQRCDWTINTGTEKNLSMEEIKSLRRCCWRQNIFYNAALSMGQKLPTFRRNGMPSFSALSSLSLTMKTLEFLGNVGNYSPKSPASEPRRLASSHCIHYMD